MAGLSAAAEVAPAVEIDVRRSLDGALVLSHDPDIAGHVVAETRWSTLSDLDMGGGHRPICLEDALEALPDLVFDIEIKNSPFQPGFEPDAATAIVVGTLARPKDYVTCFHWPTMDALKADQPHVVTGLLVDEGGSLEDAADHARSTGHEVIAPHWSLVTGQVPEGLFVAVWTMNDPNRVKSLADWGVATIITDDPGLIVDTIQRLL